MIRIGSMFAGIGGFELGVEYALRRYGYPCQTVWQIEQDQYCQRILHKHWPTAEIFDDVRECGAHNLPPCDLLLGGFPCQDISVAGKGAGLEGNRSGLFFEVVRTIREMEPTLKIFALENVPAINSNGLDRVLWEVRNLGYSARWGTLSAQRVGAPHRRQRWFLVGWKTGGVRMAHPDSQRGQPLTIRQGGQSVKNGRVNKVAHPDSNGHKTANRQPGQAACLQHRCPGIGGRAKPARTQRRETAAH